MLQADTASAGANVFISFLIYSVGNPAGEGQPESAISAGGAEQLGEGRRRLHRRDCTRAAGGSGRRLGHPGPLRVSFASPTDPWLACRQVLMGTQQLAAEDIFVKGNMQI